MVESEMVEVVIKEVGQNGLIIGHIIDNDASPISRSPQ